MILQFILLSGLSFLAPALTFAHSAAQNCGPTTLLTSDGTPLSAHWTCPTGSPLRSIVLILPGSGNVGLDGDISGPFTGAGYQGKPAKLSDQLAETLTDAGAVTFRYAKRGFENPAELPRQTAPFLIQDIHAALDVIEQTYPGRPIQIVGFSEGAILAVHALAQTPRLSVSGLHFMGLPTQNIDESLAYQFSGWPQEILKNRVNALGTQEETLEAAELASLPNAGQLPLLGMLLGPEKGHWSAWDLNLSGSLDFQTEIEPAYATGMQVVAYLLTTPAFSGWYQGLKSLPSFSTVAKTLHAPVHVYVGEADAQVQAHKTIEDSRLFPALKSSKVYPNLGHAFAPMMGTFGEIKTSGPFDSSLLNDLRQNLITLE